MKNPKVYQTSHPVSQEICQYLMKGFNAQLVPAITLLSGLVITYGILRGTGNIIRAAEAIGRPYLYCDHAYFGAYRRDRVGKDHCYYRVVKSGRYANFTNQANGDRFHKLSAIGIRPWRKSGRHIVVVPMSGFIGKFTGQNANDWLGNTMRELSKFTDRDIVIKPKDDDQDFESVIKDAWAVVAHDSMAAVDAVRLGIPAFTSIDNAAAPVANFYLGAIENPSMVDREHWLHALANQQFTLKEIENGTAQRVLRAGNAENIA